MIGNYYTSVIDSGLLGRIQIPQDGVYYLRLNVKSSAGKHYTDIIGPITADKRLKEHWPVNTQREIVSSPVISDVDGDGKNEIVINSSNGRVYMLDRDGKNKPGWPVALDSNSYHEGGISSTAVVGYCSPAAGDINNDGKEEIAVRDGQYLYVYDYLGKPLPGWPVQLGWFFIGNGQVGSPVIADIDQDGFKDILVTHLDGYIYVFDKDGKRVQGWPQKILDYAFATSFCTPVVSDINGDGKPEIIVQTLNEPSLQGSIYVYNNHGELLPGWPQIIGTGGYTSPIAVDLYNNGLNEIIACSHIAVENNVYGKLGIYAFNKDGQLLNGWPIALEYDGFGYYNVTAGLSAGDVAALYGCLRP